MQALILAAGKGTRLEELTQSKTKCMVQVNGKTIIERTIDDLVKNNFSRLIIVTGYLSDVLKDFISSKYSEINLHGMKIDFIHNPDYETTNNIYSLYLARKMLKEDDTVMIESDLIYKESLLPKLLEDHHKNVAVVSAWEHWMEGTVTLINENGEITDFIGKEKQLASERPSYYKTVNIYKFSKEFSRQYYMPFLGAYQTSFGKNVYYEDALKIISFLKKEELHALKVPCNDWYEIDTKADLKEAEKRFL